MNKENLLKLADYLETVPQEKFDIDQFRSNGDREGVEYISKDDCGTIGCALGWAPFVDGLEPIKKDFMINGFLHWYGYGKRIFDLNFFGEWGWCFSSFWEDIDNTPKGAARRIRYLVKHGLPENWFEQLLGKELYIFSDVTKRRNVGKAVKSFIVRCISRFY